MLPKLTLRRVAQWEKLGIPYEGPNHEKIFTFFIASLKAIN